MAFAQPVSVPTPESAAVSFSLSHTSAPSSSSASTASSSDSPQLPPDPGSETQVRPQHPARGCLGSCCGATTRPLSLLQSHPSPHLYKGPCKGTLPVLLCSDSGEQRQQLSHSDWPPRLHPATVTGVEGWSQWLQDPGAKQQKRIQQPVPPGSSPSGYEGTIRRPGTVHSGAGTLTVAPTPLRE